MGTGATKTKKRPDGVTVGFDLGGTKMYAVVFDDDWAPLGSARVPTEGHRGAEKGVERIIETISAALEDSGVDPKTLRAIGLGCPGIVDMKDGILHSTPNLGWPNVPLRKLVGGHFQCPAAVVNDVDAGTVGEFTVGAGKGARTLLGVFPGTGVGAGCVYDGKLLRGRRYSAMEIGRMRWPVPGLTSAPGSLPIFESFCSRLAVASACAGEAFRGNAPTLMKRSGTEVAKIKSKALATAYETGDPGVVNVFENALDYLACGIGDTINLIAPDRIVLGGGLVEAMPDVFIKGVRKRLSKFAAAELLEDLVLSPAKLGDEASVLGAAVVAKEEL